MSPAGRPEKSFTWNYSDIEKLTNQTPDAIRQHVARNKLSDKLDDLVVYLVTHANSALRQRLIDAIMTRSTEEKPGRAKKKAVKKKAAK